MIEQQSNPPLEIHLDVEDHEKNTVELLSQETQLSKQKIKAAMQKGAVWLTHGGYTQRLRRAKKTLQAGDTIHCYYDEKILNSEPQTPTLISDQSAYSIWYKPYGMYSQGSKWGDHCTINRWIEQHQQRPAFIVHRLDRAATGLMIIAHQKKTTAALAKIFEQRKIRKCYQAIVHGKFPATDTTVTINKAVEGRPAISHIRHLQYSVESNQSLIEVDIETGRKHQIRRHLSTAGHPIVGDRLYGQGGEEKNLQLCCCFLAFTCPITAEEKTYRLNKALDL